MIGAADGPVAVVAIKGGEASALQGLLSRGSLDPSKVLLDGPNGPLGVLIAAACSGGGRNAADAQGAQTGPAEATHGRAPMVVPRRQARHHPDSAKHLASAPCRAPVTLKTAGPALPLR